MFFKLLIFINDWFFSAEQQQRLSDLMNLWRTARDEGHTLPQDQQAELDRLVEAELKAATARTAALVQQLTLTENCKHRL